MLRSSAIYWIALLSIITVAQSATFTTRFNTDFNCAGCILITTAASLAGTINTNTAITSTSTLSTSIISTTKVATTPIAPPKTSTSTKTTKIPTTISSTAITISSSPIIIDTTISTSKTINAKTTFTESIPYSAYVVTSIGSTYYTTIVTGEPYVVTYHVSTTQIDLIVVTHSTTLTSVSTSTDYLTDVYTHSTLLVTPIVTLSTTVPKITTEYTGYHNTTLTSTGYGESLTTLTVSYYSTWVETSISTFYDYYTTFIPTVVTSLYAQIETLSAEKFSTATNFKTIVSTLVPEYITSHIVYTTRLITITTPIATATVESTPTSVKAINSATSSLSTVIVTFSSYITSYIDVTPTPIGSCLVYGDGLTTWSASDTEPLEVLASLEENSALNLKARDGSIKSVIFAMFTCIMVIAFM